MNWKDNNNLILNVLNLVYKEKLNKLPIECPCCSKEDVHFCFIKDPLDFHGTCWIWCSSCKTFAHFSCTVPDWWENPPFIDLNQLSFEPSYLDSIKNEIDSYVLKLRK